VLRRKKVQSGCGCREVFYKQRMLIVRAVFDYKERIRVTGIHREVFYKERMFEKCATKKEV